MAREHCYKNHEHVISVLTKEYGFTYHGVVNNGEELFIKDSKTPEKIFVHPMSCSYYRASSRNWEGPRLHVFDVKSNSSNQEEQKKVFSKLLVHLDEFSLPVVSEVTPIVTKTDIQQFLDQLEEKKEQLRDMVTDRDFKKKEMIPPIYKNLSAYHKLIEEAFSLLK